MADLTVERSVDGPRYVLAVAGELDLDSVGTLRRHAEAALADGQCRTLVLDLAALTFVDSSGLGLLVDLKRRATESGSALEIANVLPGPRRVIGIAGLTDMLGLPAKGSGPADE